MTRGRRSAGHVVAQPLAGELSLGGGTEGTDAGGAGRADGVNAIFATDRLPLRSARAAERASPSRVLAHRVTDAMLPLVDVASIPKKMRCERCRHEWRSHSASTRCRKCGHEYVRWQNFDEWQELLGDEVPH